MSMFDENYRKMVGPPPPIKEYTPPADPVNHPAHYKGKDGLESIQVIEAFELGFNLGNCIKYILRAGKKDPATRLQDLQKARWYLEREIGWMKP